MLPPLPDPHGIGALLLTVVALYLFTRDRIPLETSSLIVITMIVLGFQIFPYERDGVPLEAQDFFAGFGHEALVAISALMIAGKGLETTGALQPLAPWLSRTWTARPLLALLATLVLTAILSGFLNNTPIVVMLLPMLVGVAMRAKVAPSSVLMPMGLATIIGGMGTTIGTSSNLLIVGIAEDLGQPHINMFDFTLPVAIAGIAGILFLWLVAPRLLPDRKPPLGDTSPRVFNALLYIKEGSFASGKTLSEVLARTQQRMKVDRIQRTDTLSLAKLPSVKLQAGDRLFVKDSPENLKEFETLLGATLYNVADAEHPITEQFPLAERGQQLAEVVVTRGSPLHHETLESTRFTARYKLLPLAIHRAREQSTDIKGDLGGIRLRAGDVLLVQGTRAHINELKKGGTMLVLDGTTDLPHTHRAPRALVIMGLIVVSAATGLVPISVSALTGVGLMLISHCLTWRDIGDALSAPIILLIVASLALGLALISTGGAAYVAQLYLWAVQGLSTPFVLSGLMLVMALLTNVVSNNAAAAIGTPIAIGIAHELGITPEPFVLAVLFGVNMSYATPIGYQTNLLVMSAGGYKFSDFLRVGIPLTFIMWLAFSFLLPTLYDL
ncbi:SLC13 family permease [soil metagenome]